MQVEGRLMEDIELTNFLLMISQRNMRTNACAIGNNSTLGSRRRENKRINEGIAE
jgi:hypothetical protein